MSDLLTPVEQHDRVSAIAYGELPLYRGQYECRHCLERYEDGPTLPVPIWEVSKFSLVSLFDMLRAHGHSYYYVAYAIGVIEYCIDVSAVQADEALQNEAIQGLLPNIVRQLKSIKREAQDPALKFTLLHVDRALAHCNDKCTPTSLKIIVEELSNRFRDELGDEMFLHVSSNKTPYYKNPHLFGPEVAARFPHTNHDAEEAGKCFALGRFTACVFHLGRIMEHTVQMLGVKLSVTIHLNTTWNIITEAINNKLKLMANPQTPAPALTDADRARNIKFAKATAHLNAFRLAWRNETMHPKSTYTEEEALTLLNHVDAFMRQITKDRLTGGKPIK